MGELLFFLFELFCCALCPVLKEQLSTRRRSFSPSRSSRSRSSCCLLIRERIRFSLIRNSLCAAFFCILMKQGAMHRKLPRKSTYLAATAFRCACVSAFFRHDGRRPLTMGLRTNIAHRSCRLKDKERVRRVRKPQSQGAVERNLRGAVSLPASLTAPQSRRRFLLHPHQRQSVRQRSLRIRLIETFSELCYAAHAVEQSIGLRTRNVLVMGAEREINSSGLRLPEIKGNQIYRPKPRASAKRTCFTVKKKVELDMPCRTFRAVRRTGITRSLVFISTTFAIAKTSMHRLCGYFRYLYTVST